MYETWHNRLGVILSQEAEQYLSGHNGLGVYVGGVSQKLRDFFGPSAQLLVRMYYDPEIDDSYLQVLVRLPEYYSGIAADIQALVEPWLGDGDVLVTTDFLRI